MSGMKRREFVVFGSVSAGTLALGSLTGCVPKVTSVNGGETAAESVDQELEQAKTDWGTAFATAEENWKALQESIADSEKAVTEFGTKTVTNPDALTEFEQSIADAKAIENQHDDIVMPSEIPKIRASIATLKEAADNYQDASSDLGTKKSAIKLFDPLKGQFNVTDKDGYSYNISYNLSPSITVDATEGKPGQVALYMDLSNCSVVVKNTTSGKKAPGIVLDCAPLYSIDLFTDVVEDESLRCATFGALAQPVKLDDSVVLSDIWELEYEESHVNPFDNDNQAGMSSYEFSRYGYIANIDIHAGVVKTTSAGSNIRPGSEFDVGESRTLTIGFAGLATADLVNRIKVGEIVEKYVDRFKKISSWALYPMLKGWPTDTIYFKGETGVSSDLSITHQLYTYNPVTGTQQ
jgi:hypothetical protein